MAADLASSVEVSTALERLPDPARQQLANRITTPTDDEIRRLYRIAEALAASGIYKDAAQAGQAFAKIIVGRDLGLTPQRAMAGLHFVEGHVQIHYRTLGAFVRENGYEYRFGTGNPVEIRRRAKAEEMNQAETAEMISQDPQVRYWPIPPTNESVTLAFFGQLPEDGSPRVWLGDSTFDQADAETAGLRKDRGSQPSNFVKFPRNMLTARAMSNGLGWYVPDALRGIPVYVPDEIQPAHAELTAGSGDGEAEALELSPAIEALMQEAADLPDEIKTTETRAVANRAYVVATLGKRGPDVWRAWEKWAREQIAKATGVIGPPADALEAKQDEPSTQDAESAQDAQDAAEVETRDAADTGEAGQEQDAEAEIVEPEPEEVPARVQELMDRRAQLEERRLTVLDAAVADDDRPLTEEERNELEPLEAQIAAIDAELNPNQSPLDLGIDL